MPAPCTTDEFLALVRKSGVAAPAAVDEFAGRVAAVAGPPPGPKQLAEAMVRDGVLTVLQASQLLRGRWRNFILCGKYKLLEHLGTGGMGQVFLCEHARMRRRVAVKILPPDRAADPVCLQRFYREARAVAALNSLNVVRAHDLEVDGGLHFLVMEYVDGASLHDVVKRFGPLTVERACHYVRQAALGLRDAHDAGLIHRDIKPANLLLDRSGLVKILDLGLARFFDDAGDDLTRKFGGALLGTADYLAPEQAFDGHAADIRSDIYSLGVTFYFLLTGRSPFKDGTVAQKLLYHRLQRPEPVRNFRPDVPEPIATIVERMLAKDPAARFQVPDEVVDALDPWVVPIPPPPEVEMPRLSRAARRTEPATSPIPRSSRSTIRTLPVPPPAPAPTQPGQRRGRLAAVLAAIAGWFRRDRRSGG